MVQRQGYPGGSGWRSWVPGGGSVPLGTWEMLPSGLGDDSTLGVQTAPLPLPPLL